MSDPNNQPGNLPTQDDDVYLGKSRTPLKSSDTEQILARMQKIVDEREGALNTFQSGWKDASAWFSGGTQGPTAGLAIRDRQKQIEAQDTMRMLREMSDIKAAQAQAAEYARSQAEDYKQVGGGGGESTGTSIPGVTSQNGQYLFKGRIPLSEEEYAMAKGYRNEADRTKFIEGLVKNRSEGRVKWENDPNVYKEEQFTLDGRIRDLDTKTKRDIMAEAKRRGVGINDVAREYFDFLDGKSPAAKPSGTKPISDTTTPRVGTQAIAQVETGNREGLVSSKGAMGVMQVMPNTNRDPGFGVTPAKDNSPAELKRVGEEYFGAMQKKYKNDTLAAIAYNMGPGATDAWLKKGGEFNALPKETQNYIGKVHTAQAKISSQPDAGLTAAPAEVAARPTMQPVAAAQPSKPISQMSSAEIKIEQEKQKKAYEKDLAIEQAGGVGEMGERGKEAGLQAVALQSASSNATDRLNSVEYIRNQMKNTDVIGMLSKPTVAAALGTLLKEGFDVGSSKTSVNGLEQAIAQAMVGSKPKDIEAMQNIGREFAKMELTEARNYLKGQGAVSDAERRLITRIVATVGTSPGAINDFLKITEMRANFDQKAGAAWEKFQEDYPKESYNKFIRSDKFKTLKNEYADELKGFTQSTLQPKQPAGGAAPHPGASLVDQYLKKQ